MLEALAASVREPIREQFQKVLLGARPRCEFNPIVRDSREAGWLLAAWCREESRSIVPGTEELEWVPLSHALDAYVRSSRGRPECPWIALEVFSGAVRRSLASNYLCSMEVLGTGLGDAMLFTAFEVRPAHRRLLADHLLENGLLQADAALKGLGDRALRTPCEAWLAQHLSEVQERLQPLLESKEAGVRQAAVRLLRASAPSLTLEGRPAREGIEALEARLRLDPLDADASQIWADALAEKGDARGVHVALEHAIRTAAPAQALELSQRQAAHFAEHRERICRRSGGVPFQERYLGRKYLRFSSNHWHRLRGGKPGEILERLQRFLKTTDAAGPLAVNLGPVFFQRPESLLAEHGRALKPSNGVEQAVAALWPSARLQEAGGSRAFVAPDRSQPVGRALADVLGEGSVTYLFRFAAEGTRVPLPYQESGHYAGRTEAPASPIWSHLTVGPNTRGLILDLFFPFERFDDPGFLRLVDAIEAALGKVLTPSRFFLVSPLVSGKRMDEKKHPFARR